MAHEGPAELLREVMMDEQQEGTSQRGMGGGGVISVTQSDVLQSQLLGQGYILLSVVERDGSWIRSSR